MCSCILPLWVVGVFLGSFSELGIQLGVQVGCTFKLKTAFLGYG